MFLHADSGSLQWTDCSRRRIPLKGLTCGKSRSYWEPGGTGPRPAQPLAPGSGAQGGLQPPAAGAPHLCPCPQNLSVSDRQPRAAASGEATACQGPGCSACGTSLGPLPPTQLMGDPPQQTRAGSVGRAENQAQRCPSAAVSSGEGGPGARRVSVPGPRCQEAARHPSRALPLLTSWCRGFPIICVSRHQPHIN